MCRSAGLKMVMRIECSTCYLLQVKPTFDLSSEIETQIVNCLHDRMTHCRYQKPVESFKLDNKAEEIYEVDIMKDGREALERTNIEMGNFQIYNTVDPFLSDHPYFFYNEKKWLIANNFHFPGKS